MSSCRTYVYLLGNIFLHATMGLRFDQHPRFTGGWKTINVFIGAQSAPWSERDIPGAFHSQVGQDESVVKLFNGSRNGFFVDLAANQAISLSNTRALERDYDWDGLCVECNPTYWSDLSFRKCNLIAAVVGETTNSTAHLVFSNGAFGGIVSDQADNTGKPIEATRSMVALKDLFEASNVPSVIDYMSLDVEGAEEMVLMKFPFNKYTFRVLTIERPSEALQHMLQANGYIYVKDHGHFGDKMYVHKSFLDYDTAIERLSASLPKPSNPKNAEGQRVQQTLLCEGGACPHMFVFPIEGVQSRMNQTRRAAGLEPPWGSLLQIPDHVTHVMINIGPNNSPIRPDNDKTLVVLIEPLPFVAEALSQGAGPHTYVYQAAISNFTGKANFTVFNNNGASSSLAARSHPASWNSASEVFDVPVHTLKELLDAIPQKVNISYLKTDMQGYDLTAIKSAGDAIKRIQEIKSEVYQDGKPTYKDTCNEFNEWAPYMAQMGFTEPSCIDGYVEEPAFHEMDCAWKAAR